MTLTCITATLNVVSAGRKEALIRCVRSVAKLPMKCEHLIYDGLSNDGTLELLAALAKESPNLKVVSEKDTGIYNALNKGVRDAKGTWFYVLGADDYIFSNENLSRAISEGERTHAEIVGSPVKLPDDFVVKKDWWGLRLWLTGMPFPHQGMLMRTRLIRDLGGFDEQYKIVADFDLVQRAILNGVAISSSDAPYAFFSTNGLSSVVEKANYEYRSVLKDRFLLSEKEAEVAYPKRVLPLRVVLRTLFSKNVGSLTAGGYQFGRWLFNAMGMIDERGRVHV